MSVITESARICQLSLQAELYEFDEEEELKVDTLNNKTMQRYLNNY